MNARERPWHAASRVGAGSGPLARPYWDVVLLRVYGGGARVFSRGSSVGSASRACGGGRRRPLARASARRASRSTRNTMLERSFLTLGFKGFVLSNSQN